MENSNLFQTFGKDQHLDELIRKIVEKFDPLKIICFGRNMVHRKSVGCFREYTDTTSPHYHLLMITEATPRIEYTVQDYVNNNLFRGKITVIAHHQQIIQEKLENKHPFYCNIFRSGHLLYTKDGLYLTDTVPYPDPIQTEENAKRYFEHRYEMADGFLSSANYTLGEGHYNLGVFLLHQAVEHACRAMISVHLSYKADVHHLGKLIDMTCCFSDDPIAIFPRVTENEKRLFLVLQNSYSAGRYVDSYEVDMDDAYEICTQVIAFVGVAKSLCLKHLDSLAEINKPQTEGEVIELSRLA